MSSKHDNKRVERRPLWFILWMLAMFTISIVLVLKHFLDGLNIAVLNPKGFVAGEQMDLILVIVAVISAAAIPTVCAVYFVAWKYRESNTKSSFDPGVKFGKSLDVFMWGFPAVILVITGVILISATQRLEPQKALSPDVEPLKIQVIALRWKWLFIYPEQNIATVNYLRIPVDRPVAFDLTADETPMSSFWVPNLGGMLYAMTGHTNTLNLIADTPGEYPGSTAEINGAGFAGMTFTARAAPQDEFDGWVTDLKRSPKVLDATEYEKLLEPSEKAPVVLYASAETGLYDKVLMKYAAPEGGQTHGSHQKGTH